MEDLPRADSRSERTERILVALAAPFLGLLCFGCLIATNARFGGPSGADKTSRLLDLLFYAMFFELFIAFLLFLLVAFIWALLAPRWTVRALQYVRNHVWHALCFFLIGYAVSTWIIYAVR
jgi:hypothetical protein